MKQILRSNYWWPNIEQLIEALIKQCVPCQEMYKHTPNTHCQSWKAVEKTFERVHVDYFFFIFRIISSLYA